MAYKIVLKPSASKDLDFLPIKEVQKIAKLILQLANNPRPPGVQKLTDKEGYRIRSGKYRILFEINDKLQLIHVFRVKHRKDVYK